MCGHSNKWSFTNILETPDEKTVHQKKLITNKKDRKFVIFMVYGHKQQILSSY